MADEKYRTVQLSDKERRHLALGLVLVAMTDKSMETTKMAHGLLVKLDMVAYAIALQKRLKTALQLSLWYTEN